jgi:hypothetical protein
MFISESFIRPAAVNPFARVGALLPGSIDGFAVQAPAIAFS